MDLHGSWPRGVARLTGHELIAKLQDLEYADLCLPVEMVCECDGREGGGDAVSVSVRSHGGSDRRYLAIGDE